MADKVDGRRRVAFTTKALDILGLSPKYPSILSEDPQREWHNEGSD